MYRKRFAEQCPYENAANDLASARHERKEAFTNYFPSISATGGGFLSSTHLLGMEMGPGMSLGLMKDGLVGGVTASMPLFTEVRLCKVTNSLR